MDMLNNLPGLENEDNAPPSLEAPGQEQPAGDAAAGDAPADEEVDPAKALEEAMKKAE
jgi:hypothetical protein